MAGDTRHILIADVGRVTVRRHHWAKNISLKITAQGNVSISAPPRTPLKLIKLFIISKKGWMLAQLSQSQTASYTNGQTVAGNYKLVFRPLKHLDAIRTGTKDHQITVSHPEGLSSNDPSVQARAHKAVERAARREATAHLPKRLKQLSIQTGLTYNDCRLRNMKRKWGSCSNQKVITLNIWLITLPRQLIDYVLLHELVHTKHMHHQADFWKLMEDLEPNARKLARQARHYQS